MTTGPVRSVAVVGARGGAGASCLAYALAVAAARTGRRVAAVDLDHAGPGLEVLAGLEESAGARWPDLQEARGQVRAEDLVAVLPIVDGVRLLSGDRRSAAAPPPEVRRTVIDVLAATHDLVVLDVPRADAAACRGCDAAVLVVTRDVAGVAGALTLVPVLRAAVADARLVVRGPAPGGIGVGEVAARVGLPLAATCPADRGLAAAIDRGVPPGVLPGSAWGRAAQRVLQVLGVEPAAPSGARVSRGWRGRR